jgi:hypothetical protein
LVVPSSVDEMVLAFLRAEVDSPRYREFFVALGLDRRLVEQPVLTDPGQNKARADALAAHRGNYVGALPLDTTWQRWALTLAELGDALYAKYVTWQRLSGGTRRIRDGAANVDKLQCYENGHDINAGIRATARAIDEGKPMPELIAVAEAADGRNLVLLEGHTRATAYLTARRVPVEVILLVGWSTTMNRWHWF